MPQIFFSWKTYDGSPYNRPLVQFRQLQFNYFHNTIHRSINKQYHVTRPLLLIVWHGCFKCLRSSYIHCLESDRIRSFSSPYFPEFGLNTESYGLSLRIQSECAKLRAIKTPNRDTFHAMSAFKIINSFMTRMMI